MSEKHSRAVILAFMASLITVYFFVNFQKAVLIPVFNELQADFGVNAGAVTGVTTAFMLVYAAMQFATGLIVDRYGGIRVLTVLPGRIDTGFSKRAVGGRQVPETPGRRASSAEGLARRVYRAFVRRRRRLIYPAWYALAIAFIRHFPAVNEYFNRKLWGLNRE